MKLHSKRTLTLVLLALLCLMLAAGAQEDVQQEEQQHHQQEEQQHQRLELSNAGQEQQHAVEQQAPEQQVRVRGGKGVRPAVVSAVSFFASGVLTRTSSPFPLSTQIGGGGRAGRSQGA